MANSGTGNPITLVGTKSVVILPVVITSFASEMLFDFSSYNEVVPSSIPFHYLVRITHNDSSNDYRLVYIDLTVEVDSVEEGIGAF